MLCLRVSHDPSTGDFCDIFIVLFFISSLLSHHILSSVENCLNEWSHLCLMLKLLHNVSQDSHVQLTINCSSTQCSSSGRQSQIESKHKTRRCIVIFLRKTWFRFPLDDPDIGDIIEAIQAFLDAISKYITPLGEGVSEACINASNIYLDALNDVGIKNQSQSFKCCWNILATHLAAWWSW